MVKIPGHFDEVVSTEPISWIVISLHNYILINNVLWRSFSPQKRPLMTILYETTVLFQLSFRLSKRIFG